MTRVSGAERSRTEASGRRHETCIFQFENGRTAVKVPRKRGRPKGNSARTARSQNALEGAFDFVQMDGQSNVTDKDARKMIRRRAMVNCVRLKKRQKLDESSDTSSQPSPPPEIAGADPFGVFSAHIEPYMLDLFKFYINIGWKAFYTVEKYTSFNPMTEYWLEMAMSDSAFFHTLLGCADSYVSPKGWQRNSPITVKHLNKAISIVNQRIKRDEIPSDGTIVVVATMACVEKSRGAHKNWEVHMKGLKQLVDLRGGITVLESQPLLMNKIYRADLCGCLDAVRSPYFSNGGIPIDTAGDSRPGFPLINLPVPLDRHLVLCIETLAEAMRLKKNLTKTSDHIDAATIRYLVTNTQYTLLSVEYADLVNEIARLALIMFSLMVVNEASPYLVCEMLVGKLWRVYEGHNGSRLLQIGGQCILPPELRLWVFLFASVCTVDGESESKCAREFMAASSELGIGEWSDVEHVLKNLLWDEALDQGKLRAIWEDAAEKASFPNWA